MLMERSVLRPEDFVFGVGLFQSGFESMDFILRATFQMAVAKLIGVGI